MFFAVTIRAVFGKPCPHGISQPGQGDTGICPAHSGRRVHVPDPDLGLHLRLLHGRAFSPRHHREKAHTKLVGVDVRRLKYLWNARQSQSLVTSTPTRP